MPVYDLPPKILCRVINVQLKAEPNTDEVFAQVTLLPELNQDENVVEKEPPPPPPSRFHVHSFCKTLTVSDTSTHDGFSVLRRHGDECLPPLDMSKQHLHRNWWLRIFMQMNGDLNISFEVNPVDTCFRVVGVFLSTKTYEAVKPKDGDCKLFGFSLISGPTVPEPSLSQRNVSEPADQMHITAHQQRTSENDEKLDHSKESRP